MKKLKFDSHSLTETDLDAWEYTRSCVISDADIMVYGRVSTDAKPVMNIYHEGRKMRSLMPPCEHEKIHLQPLVIDSDEYIAISCGGKDKCNRIYLMDPFTGKFTTAYEKDGHQPRQMCQGSLEILFVRNQGNNKVLKLDVSEKQFKFKGEIINTEIDGMHGMAYLTYPENTLVLTSWKNNTIRAINPDNEKEIWKTTGELGGEMCKPHGVVITKQGHVIVADGNNARLIVLHVATGQLINVHDLESCTAADLHLVNKPESLLLRYKHKGIQHISYHDIAMYTDTEDSSSSGTDADSDSEDLSN